MTLFIKYSNKYENNVQSRKTFHSFHSWPNKTFIGLHERSRETQII